MTPTSSAKVTYGIHARELASAWTALEKHDKPVLDEPSVGTRGYAMSKQNQHLYRLSLVPADAKGRFFWTALESADGGVNFAFPALMAKEDLPRLLELWELDDERTIWTPGLMVSPTFPKGWRMPEVFFQTARQFYVMVRKTTADMSVSHLTARGGIHTTTGSKVSCMGIVGESGDLDVFRAMPPPTPGTSLLRLDVNLAPEALTLCREASARFFKQKLLVVGEGKVFPYMPHATVVGIPSMGITELSL